MKLMTVNIAGADRPLCFSTKVLIECTDRYGSVDGISSALTQDNQGKALQETLWLISVMLDAGEKYSKLMGKDVPKALTAEELEYVCSLEDFKGLAGKIREAIDVSSASTVEVETSKK